MENLIPLLRAKKEEKRIELHQKEKYNKGKKRNSKYPYKSLKLLVDIVRYDKIIKEFYIDSKESDLISSETSLANFSKVFRGVGLEILLDNRIIWKQSVPALKYFVDELIKQELIEALPRSGKWEIICNCFCNSNKAPYTNDSFRNNSDTVMLDVKNEINDIIKPLKIDCE